MHENPALVGNYLPQVPQHRGSVTITYSNPRFVSASVSGLFFGRQFEDDQNILARPGNFAPGLPAYAVVELMVTRALGRHADVFFGVQNLFNEEYSSFYRQRHWGRRVLPMAASACGSPGGRVDTSVKLR